MIWSLSELFHEITHSFKLLRCREGLAKLPISRDDIVHGERSSVAYGDFDWQPLSIQIRIALPIRSPISLHRFPFGTVWPFYPCRFHISSSPNFTYQNQLQVVTPIYCETYSSILLARIALIQLSSVYLIYHRSI